MTPSGMRLRGALHLLIAILPPITMGIEKKESWVLTALYALTQGANALLSFVDKSTAHAETASAMARVSGILASGTAADGGGKNVPQ